MKKIFATILLLSILLSLFACQKNEPSSLDNDGNTSTPSDEIEQIDMNGYVFKMSVHNWPTPPELSPDLMFDARRDSLLERYSDLEKTFNLVMERPETDTTKATKEMAAGLVYADLIEADLNGVITLAKSDLVYDINTFESFDLSSGKFGTENMLYAGNYKGSQAGFKPNYWGLPMPNYVGALWYIDSNITNYNLTNPHEFYEKGTWNWANFRTLCELFSGPGDDATNKNDDTYGFGYGTSAYMADLAISSNGGARVVIKDDKYVFGLTEPEATEAILWMKKLIDDGLGFFKKGDWSGDARYTFFDKRYLFCIDNAWVGLYNTEGHVPYHVKESYGWIDFPYGPNGDPKAVNAIISEKDKFLCIPITSDSYQIEPIVNFLLEPLGNDTPTSWQDDYNSLYFFDNASFEAFLRMRDGTVYDYGAHMGDGARTRIINAINNIISGKSTPAESFGTIEERIQEVIDETIAY